MTIEQLKNEEFATSSYELNDALITKIKEGGTTDPNAIRADIDRIIKRAKAEILVKVLNEVESQAANLL